MDNGVEFMATLYPGAWIQARVQGDVKRGLLPCQHHGIVSRVDDGSIRVIHFTRPEDDPTAPREVRETSLEFFLSGCVDPRVSDAEPAFAFDVVAQRARKYVGASQYSLPTRNCEHFASWCFLGSAFSRQVFAFGLGASVVAVIVGVIGVAAMGMSQAPWS